jgi:hypothetical protein
VDIANFGLSLAAGTNNSPYCLEEDYNWRWILHTDNNRCSDSPAKWRSADMSEWM